MFRTCIVCGEPTILGRCIDNVPVVMDGKPVAGGAAVLVGDLNDQPTVIFGVDTVDDAAFYGIPFDSDRYDRHDCKG